MSELQQTIYGWEGKDIDQYCNEFIMDGPLGILSTSGHIAERHVFLFDRLMVLCKPNNKRSPIILVVTGDGVGAQYEWRFKEKHMIRNIEIIDRPDFSDNDIGNDHGQNNTQKFAFEIIPRNQPSIILFAKTLEEKALWMSNLILLHTQSILKRTLDSMADEGKKHPLVMPSPDIYRFAVEDSDFNIIFEENKFGTTVPLIKGATLLKLVERLTYHMYADPMFMRTFLTTYRSFCTPEALLDLLIERFEIPEPEFSLSLCSSPPNTILSETITKHNKNYNNEMDGQTQRLVGATADQQIYENTEIRSNYREILKRFRKEYSQPVQFRVLNVLRHWIDHHYYDFERDGQLLYKLQKFLNEKVKPKKNMKKLCDNVKKLLDRKSELSSREQHIAHSFDKNPPNTEWWITRDPDKFDLLTLHPVELARQLTLLEFDLYRVVKPSELVGTVWTKKDKMKTSPNLLRMIRHTSNFTFWLERCIVEAENFDERVAIMTRIIEIMIVLQDLNNFNGVLEVISAISSACIHRLEHTMSYIERNSKLRRALLDAQELSADHFKRYHEKLRSINPPCVPFFGMYLTNILHIEEGNTDCLVSENKAFNHYGSDTTLTSVATTTSSAHTTNMSMMSLNSSTASCVSRETVHSSMSSANSATDSVSMSNESVPNSPTQSPNEVLINFSKRRKVAEITAEIQQYQNLPYCLTVVPGIRHFLESLNPFGNLDEKELTDYLYSKSLEIEPRGYKQPKKFSRRWPELSLKSPGIKPKSTRGHHLPALQSLEQLLITLANSTVEEYGESRPRSRSPPPPYSDKDPHPDNDPSANHSVFAPVFIGPSSKYNSCAPPAPPVHTTAPAQAATWASFLFGYSSKETIAPPLPPRSVNPMPTQKSYGPTIITMPNSYDSPPPHSTTIILPPVTHHYIY